MVVDVATPYIAAVASTPGVVGSVRSGFFSTKVECKVTPARHVARLVIKAEDAALHPLLLRRPNPLLLDLIKRGFTVKILRRESY